MKAASQVGFLVLIKLVAFDIVLSSHQSFDAVTIHDAGSTFFIQFSLRLPHLFLRNNEVRERERISIVILTYRVLLVVPA